MPIKYHIRKFFRVKRPSHVKLILGNSCWQTQIGVSEGHNNVLANCWRKKSLFLFSPTLANVFWPIQIGVCERHNNMLADCWRKVGENRNKLYFSPTVCQHVVMSFTHTNLNWPKHVGQHSFDV